MAGSSQPRLSPWAERFGVSDCCMFPRAYGQLLHRLLTHDLLVPWKDENKSGLHPRWPDIDVDDGELLPLRQYINLSSSITLPLPSDPDLDRIFLEEKHQSSILNGFVSCVYIIYAHLKPIFSLNIVGQAVLLGALDRSAPQSLTIEESNWLPLLAKKRWYNLNQPLTPTQNETLDRRLTADATWSVDDPILWEALSPAIQLASNLLRATVHHPL